MLPAYFMSWAQYGDVILTLLDTQGLVDYCTNYSKKSARLLSAKPLAWASYLCRSSEPVATAITWILLLGTVSID